MRNGAATRSSLTFGVLGPLQVHVANEALVIAGRRRRAVLARLLLSANRVVSADRLIEDLWGDALPDEPTNALQASVSYLRTLLEPDRRARGSGSVLLTTKPGYTLSVSTDNLDALRFEELIRRGRSALEGGEVSEAAGLLSAAARTWRGPLLPEFAGEPWAAAEAARLGELRADTLENLFEAELALGRHGGLIGQLEEAVREWPFRERLYGQLMLALYRSGRQTEALQVFQSLRRGLAEELGIEPGGDLRRLEEAVLLQKPELDWQRPESGRAVLARAPAANPHNLPAPLASFVGRRAELATLRALLPSTRLLTLTGPGGVGKTRLALQLGAEILDEQPDGVWVVELASTSDPSLVPVQVRGALGLGEESDSRPLETIARHLRSRQVLLVLDNCEHLIEACAGLAEDLLRSCPRLHILATSRQRLRVEGEIAWAVPSLSLPQPDGVPGSEVLARSDAARLFVERVGAARAGRVLSPADECAVVDICRRLEGIPLALELAAARANVLALPEIATRLGDRFALLTVSSRSAPRHRTLRAAVDWTYDALSEPERSLFERMSVFAGGFTLDAAEQVCVGGGVGRHDVLELLATLTDKSVVSATERAGASRYGLLETLRQYAADKLRERGEEPQFRDRHLAWAVSLAETAEAELCGAHVRRRLEALDDEYDNLQAALLWAESRGHHRWGLRLATGIRIYWEMRGRVGEGRAWLERLLAVESETDPLLKARGLVAASSLAMRQGDAPKAERFAVESLALAESAGSARDVGRACLAVGNAAVEQAWTADELSDQAYSDLPDYITMPAGALRRATTAYERALHLARIGNDRFAIAMALVNLGNVARCEGDLAKARPLLEESLALRRVLGNPAYVGRSLSFLGLEAHLEGRLEDAHGLLEESVSTLREVGDERGLADALRRQAGALRAGKDFQRACSVYREAAFLAARSGSFSGMISSIVRAGEAAALAGDGATGGYLLGVAQRLLSGAGSVSQGYGTAHRQRLERVLVTVRCELGGRDIDLAFDEATRLSVDEAISYVQNLVRGTNFQGGPIPSANGVHR